MTKIEWVARPGTTPESWSPITGCNIDGKRVKVSPGCDHCWAERMARRLAGRFGYPEMPHHFDVTGHSTKLEQPFSWRKPRTVFVCSMGDLFHPGVSFSDIDKVFLTIAKAPNHTFLILTKRVHRMFDYFYGENVLDYCEPINFWLGVTIVNQEEADRYRKLFSDVPAARVIIKYVSYEPALGPVDWTGWEFVDQIISGGESGPGARPSHPDWHRVTRDFCQENGIAYFLKQWGKWVDYCNAPPDVRTDMDKGKWHDGYVGDAWHVVYAVGKKRAGHLLDGQEWREFPDD